MDVVFENVLFVGPEKGYGGMGSVLETYSKYIPGFTFVPTYPSTAQKKIGIQFKALRIAFFFRGMIKILRIFLYNRKIKIVHLHAASKGSFFRKSCICYVSKMFNKKVIFHIHSGHFHVFYNQSKILKKIIRHTLRISDSVICLSQQWRNFFIGEVGLTNTFVLGNPIESHYSEEKKFSNGVVHLLFLGKICNEKGLFDLIVFLESNKYYLSDRIKLFIAGDGEVERLELLLKNPVFKNINYLGWINGARKISAIRDCDIYILPSYFEGLPISVLEAMSGGKPIISTRVGGIPEIVKDHYNGWLIRPGCFSDLDDVFDEIFANKNLLKVYGSNSYVEAEKFSPDKILKKLASLNHSLLSS